MNDHSLVNANASSAARSRCSIRAYPTSKDAPTLEAPISKDDITLDTPKDRACVTNLLDQGAAQGKGPGPRSTG